MFETFFIAIIHINSHIKALYNCKEMPYINSEKTQTIRWLTMSSDGGKKKKLPFDRKKTLAESGEGRASHLLWTLTGKQKEKRAEGDRTRGTLWVTESLGLIITND